MQGRGSNTALFSPIPFTGVNSSVERSTTTTPNLTITATNMTNPGGGNGLSTSHAPTGAVEPSTSVMSLVGPSARPVELSTLDITEWLEIQSSNPGGPYSIPVVKINALTNNLRDGDMFSSLAKKLVHTFDELLKRAKKYVTLEEVHKAKKAEAKSSAHDKKKEPEVKSTGPDPPKSGKTWPRGTYEKYTPLKLELAENEIERLIQEGHLKEFVYRDRQGPQGYKRKEHEEKHDEKIKSPFCDVGDPST
ncbi:hypothetical protein ACS0TY_023763 [Phlomoides rotata]